MPRNKEFSVEDLQAFASEMYSIDPKLLYTLTWILNDPQSDADVVDEADAMLDQARLVSVVTNTIEVWEPLLAELEDHHAFWRQRELQTTEAGLEFSIKGKSLRDVAKEVLMQPQTQEMLAHSFPQQFVDAEGQFVPLEEASREMATIAMIFSKLNKLVGEAKNSAA